MLQKALMLACDATGCEAGTTFEGRGDEPNHEAERAGWRITPTGRALCERHARRERPDTFARAASEPTDEDLLA